MRRRFAALCCAAIAGGLGGCGTIPDLGPALGGYDVPRTAAIEADWPRLADVPDAPPPGVWSAAVPDPAQGAEVVDELSAEAAVAAVRAETLAGPVSGPIPRPTAP